MFLLIFSLLGVPALADPGFDGVWRQPCQRGYAREEIFAGSSATYTERNFWDRACTAPAVEIVSRGTIQMAEPMLEAAGARPIDFTFTSVSLKPASPRTAEAWRERGVCGFRDWQSGQEKDVTGRECDFFGLGSVVRVPRAGDQRFGIAKISGGELFLGRLSPARDGSSPGRRPLELDPLGYQRQVRKK